MTGNDSHPLFQRLAARREELTPKGRIIGDFVAQNPRKAVFMRARELAEACQVSEATVVRFVAAMGYEGYSEFVHDLRDFVDTELTLVERVELTNMSGPGGDRLRKVVYEEIANLKQFYENLDLENIDRAVELLIGSPSVYVIGSRLSYTFAYYLGWSLTKVRPHVRIFKGSDSTTIDWLTNAPRDSLVIIIATSRYPNELIRMARLVRRIGQTLMVIADSALCPVTQFAHLSIVARSLHFPIVGSPSSISCLVNCLVAEMVGRGGEALRRHQERLEQSYLENDILFNLEGMGPIDQEV